MQTINAFSFNKFLNYDNINKNKNKTEFIIIIICLEDKTYIKVMTIKSNEHNPLTLKLLFILIIYLLATHWPPF